MAHQINTEPSDAATNSAVTAYWRRKVGGWHVLSTIYSVLPHAPNEETRDSQCHPELFFSRLEFSLIIEDVNLFHGG